MQIQKITRSKNDNYTTLCNVALRDKRLSLKAKGFFALVMSLPPDWDFSIKGMEAILQEGKHSIYACLKELIDLGYVKRERRYENGKVAEWSYVFNERPSVNAANKDVDLLPENLEVENLEIENLDVENLVLENQPQISKEVNKERTKETPAKAEKVLSPHQLLMKHHADRIGTVLDGKKQGSAVKELLKHFSVEDCIACYDYQLQEAWRDGNVSWLSVRSGTSGIAQWAVKNKPEAPKEKTNGQHKNAIAMRKWQQYIANLNATPTGLLTGSGDH